MSTSIAIVPGHAGKDRFDPGAVDPKDLRENDHLASREVEHTLPLATLLCVQLGPLGIAPHVVTGDVADTVEKINAGPFTAAVSLHFNAASISQAHGAEVWYQPANLSSQRLANLILTEILTAPYPIRDRGLKAAVRGTRASSFLGWIRTPAVLVEGGFLTNPEEERRIHTPLYRLHLTQAVAKGLAIWLKR